MSTSENSPEAGGSLGSVVADLRLDYRFGSLVESEAPLDPFELFEAWFGAVLDNPGTDEPTAMTLATVDPSTMTPSARTVLLKGFDRQGFCWFTNYESRKGRELAANPIATLAFRWGTFERQVIVTGSVEKVDASESDVYFASRPVGSQIGAIISAQSTVVADRSDLDRQYADLLRRVEAGEKIQRPSHWGGYRMRPSRIEFWQGRSSRIHDRLVYTESLASESASAARAWDRVRLAP
jgi:pyridoxamine 5'-phosphate oxidase